MSLLIVPCPSNANSHKRFKWVCYMLYYIVNEALWNMYYNLFKWPGYWQSIRLNKDSNSKLLYLEVSTFISRALRKTQKSFPLYWIDVNVWYSPRRRVLLSLAKVMSRIKVTCKEVQLHLMSQSTLTLFYFLFSLKYLRQKLWHSQTRVRLFYCFLEGKTKTKKNTGVIRNENVS